MEIQTYCHIYRPEKKLFLEVDASLLGLGCALLQPKSNDEHELDSLVPIAYGSKTLNGDRKTLCKHRT